jgi:hypothetical protein
MHDDLMPGEQQPGMPGEQQPGRDAVQRGGRLNTVLEWAGFGCLVGFGAFVWPPAALAVAGLVLVVTANAQAARARPKPLRTPLLERIARAIAAYQGGRT